MADDTTPSDLARELGVTPLTIRNYLRSRWGKLPPHETRWVLTDARASEVRAYFRGRSL
ncbi:MAG: hypothetical protein JWP32_975 [Schumannella sp.]|nr:hypothetical protein [Schumannella sp.]